MSTRKIKVIVKCLTEEGKYLLREIRGLYEGDVIEGIFNDINNAVDFKWGIDDVVLWLGTNCEETKSRKKGLNLKLKEKDIFKRYNNIRQNATEPS